MSTPVDDEGRTFHGVSMEVDGVVSEVGYYYNSEVMFDSNIVHVGVGHRNAIFELKGDTCRVGDGKPDKEGNCNCIPESAMFFSPAPWANPSYMTKEGWYRIDITHPEAWSTPEGELNPSSRQEIKRALKGKDIKFKTDIWEIM